MCCPNRVSTQKRCDREDLCTTVECRVCLGKFRTCYPDTLYDLLHYATVILKQFLWLNRTVMNAYIQLLKVRASSAPCKRTPGPSNNNDIIVWVTVYACFYESPFRQSFIYKFIHSCSLSHKISCLEFSRVSRRTVWIISVARIKGIQPRIELIRPVFVNNRWIITPEYPNNRIPRMRVSEYDAVSFSEPSEVIAALD